MKETEAKWAERVREWRASGKTAEEFVEGRDFKASTLRVWASTLRRREGARPSTKSGVKLLRVIARPTPSPPSLEVAVGHARVLVRPGFDSALLRQLVEALGGAS